MIELSNLGNSPALGVWNSPSLCLARVGKPHVLEERKRICEQCDGHPAGPPDLGHVIFPGTLPSMQSWTISATAEDLRSCLIGAGETTEGPYVNGMYGVNIILCVAYRSTIDQTARHYTAYIYDLSWAEPGHPLIGARALPYQETVPIDQLRVMNSLWAPIFK
jgi:hypothetical protein